MTDVAPILSARDIVSGYGPVQILKGVSVEVLPGEIVTIIGPNGAGKSTLLKAIFGLLPVTEGHVSLHGIDITRLSTENLVRAGVGFVPQTNNVFSSLTIRENLLMGGFIRDEGLQDRFDWVVSLFPDLGSRLSEKTGKLSGGQRQMVAIGRALMLEPKILLLDEPSASLSPKMSEMVFEKVREINALGTAALMVEQDAQRALAISHRGYVLAAGENRYEGPASDLLGSDDVRRLYLGA
jgi:ABC-type branched-subunit amino acid transport system ATPase component